MFNWPPQPGSDRQHLHSYSKPSHVVLTLMQKGLGEVVLARQLFPSKGSTPGWYTFLWVS